MKRLAELVTFFPRRTWIIVCLIVCGAGLLTSQTVLRFQEADRLTQLKTETSRRSIDIMSQTLNGSLMGSLSLLGWVGEDIKKEIQTAGVPATDKVIQTLANLGQMMNASGVLLIGNEGLIKAAWDSAGKPSTGMNVAFRPYFQMSMKGKENVYAAISLARGERALYFSVPVFSGTDHASPVAGVAVARTGLEKVDALLQGKSDIALLLSPQGVVFASNRPEWIGFLSEPPTDENLQAIRELKQFGNLFDKKTFNVLPVSVSEGIKTLAGNHYAIASSDVHWNDPQGPWKLVLMENLSRTSQVSDTLWASLIAGLLTLLILQMGVKMLRGRHAQLAATRKLQTFADRQAASIEHKSSQAMAGMRFQKAGTLTELGQLLLSEMHHLFGALQGLVYIKAEEGSHYTLAASFGCAEPAPPQLREGEGLTGQCLRERSFRLIKAPDDRFWRIHSGTGETLPATLVLAPIQLQENVLGIVEIALLTVPDSNTCEQVQELIGLFAISLDILRLNLHTEKMLSGKIETEKALSDQLDFQQSLIDTIPYPVFYKGPDTRFLGINLAYCNTFGVKPADMIGKRVLDLLYLPEADRLAYQAEDEATTRAISSVSRRMIIPFADGKLHDTLYFVSGFRQKDGSPGGLVGTFIDLDDLLKNEERSLEHTA